MCFGMSLGAWLEAGTSLPQNHALDRKCSQNLLTALSGPVVALWLGCRPCARREPSSSPGSSRGANDFGCMTTGCARWLSSELCGSMRRVGGTYQELLFLSRAKSDKSVIPNPPSRSREANTNTPLETVTGGCTSHQLPLRAWRWGGRPG